MATSEDIQTWAKKQNLEGEIAAILEENGFKTAEGLSVLTPAHIKEAFQDSGLLNIAQCLALKRAVATLTSTPTAGAACGGGMEGSGEVSDRFRFFLLGKTGSGKSTTGNTIFGERLFDTAATFCSVTSDCERKTNTRGGRKIEIIDSPGLYDTHKTQEEIGVTIVQAVAGMHPGPHAILYVVRLGRYTADEYGAYQRLKALFDEAISRYTIVVFTHGDMLELEDGRTINDLINSSDLPQNLQQVLRECNNRYIVFNNKAANPQPQVEQLLQMVRAMMMDNGGQPYSCPKYSSIGQGMEEEVARRLQEVEKRDLQRQKYVQQLEQQIKEAEETARTAQEQFEKNEEERRQMMKAEEERRLKLEEQLQAQISEQQIGFEKYLQELQRLHKEQEEQEQMMKEKDAQMTEMEKKRAEEQAERMRQQEQEMQAMLTQHEQRMQQQRQKEEERHQKMERDHEQCLKRMEEQRRKEELEKREEGQRLLEQQREMEFWRAMKREEYCQEVMEDRKIEAMENKRSDIITTSASVFQGIVEFVVNVLQR